MCNHRELDYWQFVWGIEQLLGKENRYSKKDYEKLWDFLVGKDQKITWDRFARTIGKGIRDEWWYQPPNKDQSYPIQLSEEKTLVMKLSQNRKALT